MPVITGYGFIPWTSIGSGGFVEITDPGFESWSMTEAGVTGAVDYVVDPNGVFELFQDDGTPMGFKEIINLPVDFTITAVQTWPRPLITVFPNQTTFGGASLAPPAEGWDGDASTWDEAWTELLYDPFGLSVTCSILTGTGEQRFGADDNATDYGVEGVNPTNQYKFYFSGTFTDIVLDPPTDPVLEPVPDPTTLTVTLPDGTTGVIVEQAPSPPEAEVPADPGPYEIILDPGVEVVVVTPIGDDGSGPPLIVPVDYPVGDVLLTIDLDVDAEYIFVLNPSGIYTLVPGLTHDVLYSRVSGTTVATSQTVPIPRPYGITTYIPEQE